MNFISNKNIKKLFLSKQTHNTANQPLILILSPQLYWVREFTISVSSIQKAKKLLPALFEDILPHSNFQYYLIKKDDKKYLCFAYDNQEILDIIKKANISTNQIKGIYLAQNEFNSFDDFNIGDQTYSYIDDILIKVPATFKHSFLNIEKNIDDLKLSDHKIDIKFYSNTIDTPIIYKFSAALFLFTIFNIYAIFDLQNDSTNIENKIEKIKSTHNMPNSTIQTNAIISDMNIRTNRQVLLTQTLNTILNHPKITQGDIKKIEFKNKILQIEFKSLNASVLKKELAKTVKITQIQNNIIKVEL